MELCSQKQMIVLKINSLTIEVLDNVVLAQPESCDITKLHSLCKMVEGNSGKLNLVTLRDKNSLQTRYQNANWLSTCLNWSLWNPKTTIFSFQTEFQNQFETKLSLQLNLTSNRIRGCFNFTFWTMFGSPYWKPSIALILPSKHLHVGRKYTVLKVSTLVHGAFFK